jgi:hypothetical protein
MKRFPIFFSSEPQAPSSSSDVARKDKRNDERDKPIVFGVGVMRSAVAAGECK